MNPTYNQVYADNLALLKRLEEKEQQLAEIREQLRLANIDQANTEAALADAKKNDQVNQENPMTGPFIGEVDKLVEHCVQQGRYEERLYILTKIKEILADQPFCPHCVARLRIERLKSLLLEEVQ